MSHPIFKKINASLQEFIDIRHHLHQHPEVGFEEVMTSDLVAEKLQSWGYAIDRGMAKTGVVGTLKLGDSKKVLGLRADMDALPMAGDNGKAWSSKIENRFHGCGHDGHTTILLMAAKYLAESKNFNGTLKLIFQPAEELLYGGKVMMEDGLLEKHPCDMIFGLHNMPNLKKGEFYLRTGAMMASSDTIDIEITGVGGHGAMPEGTVDAGVVACYIVTALQTIVARNVAPFDKAVITVGAIQSGAVANIINHRSLLKLSVRTLDNEVRELVVRRISEIAEHQAMSFGATVKVSHINGCPVLVTTDEATELGREVVRETFGEEILHESPQFMASDDFAFMLNTVGKGTYVFVGSGEGASVHHPKYDFNDELIAPAATFWCALTEKYLKK